MSDFTSTTDRIAAEAEKRQRENRQSVYDKLAELGGGSTMREESVTYIEGSAIGLPSDPRITENQAITILQAKVDADAQTFSFTKIFDYKPFDGAYVTQLTFKELFGLAANGKATQSFFGSTPPQVQEIKTGPGPDDRVVAPWGQLSLQYRGAELTINLGAYHDNKKGWLFVIQFEGPKKFEREMHGLCRVIEQKLKTHSIYKGKAIRIEQGAQEPIFVDPYEVDANKVAYSEDVLNSLKMSTFGPLRNAEEFRRLGIPLDTKTLVYGRYGTGKTLALKITAQVAVENGWTFIQGKAGENNVEELFELARLYAPSVVAIEDIDVLVKNSVSEDEQKRQTAQLLDAFDGQTKGKEVMVVMTTNHYDDLPKPMTRPGRIDYPIEVSFPDKSALKHLIEANFHEGEIVEDLDYDVLLEAFKGFTPAFIVSTLNDVRKAAVIRRAEGGHNESFDLCQEDFVIAAGAKKTHVDSHENARVRGTNPSMEDMFRGLLADVVDNRYLSGSDENLSVEKSDRDLA